MYTNVQIINLGLTKIGSARISRIDPPVSSLEKICAEGYPQWKRSELTRRRWVFATEAYYKLTQVDEVPGIEQPYKYSIPVDCLRPIREKRTEWTQRGKFIWSSCQDLRISYIKNVEEKDLEALFVDVLATRIALECVEAVTQSNTKKADVEALYQQSVNNAGQVNAFVRGPEDIQEDDNDFSFIYSRY